MWYSTAPLETGALFVLLRCCFFFFFSKQENMLISERRKNREKNLQILLNDGARVHKNIYVADALLIFYIVGIEIIYLCTYTKQQRERDRLSEKNSWHFCESNVLHICSMRAAK